MKKMTNEKAKECLDAIIGTWEICQNQKYPSAVDVEIDAEDIVALKMAITALSQELCTDAISREWLKTAIHNFYYGLKHTPTEEDIQAYIDAAPSVSAEKTGRWIPVSEKMPKNSGRYLACIVNKHDDKLQYIITCDYSVDGYWHWFPDDECASDNVVAWMSLPEPYKGESEDKE